MFSESNSILITLHARVGISQRWSMESYDDTAFCEEKQRWGWMHSYLLLHTQADRCQRGGGGRGERRSEPAGGCMDGGWDGRMVEMGTWIFQNSRVWHCVHIISRTPGEGFDLLLIWLIKYRRGSTLSVVEERQEPKPLWMAEILIIAGWRSWYFAHWWAHFKLEYDENVILINIWRSLFQIHISICKSQMLDFSTVCTDRAQNEACSVELIRYSPFVCLWITGPAGWSPCFTDYFYSNQSNIY